MIDADTKKKIREKVIPQFTKLIDTAPQYGYCQITVTFHAGKAVRVDKSISVSIKPDYEGEEG
jgi:hypothetical protein